MKQMLESALNKVELSREQKEGTKEKMRAILQGKSVKVTKLPNKGKKIGFSSLAVASLFVLLVNISPSFALACSRIPFLDKLAHAVNFSYSLSRAVEEEFVQYIGESYSNNGITLTVEHLIVDQKEVHIFVDFPKELLLEGLNPELTFEKEEVSNEIRVQYSHPNPEDYIQFTLTFQDEIVPDTLDFLVYVGSFSANKPDNISPLSLEYVQSYFEQEIYPKDYYAIFPITLEFDPYFTEQGRVYQVNQTFQVNGQQFSIDELEVFPTHMSMDIHQHSENTKELVKLSFSLINENGELLAGERTGTVLYFPDEHQEIIPCMMESDFFDESEHISFQVEETLWREKEQDPIIVNLKQETAENCPEFFDITVSKEDYGYKVLFQEEINPLYPKLNQWAHIEFVKYYAYDEEGERYSFGGGGFSNDEYKEKFLSLKGYTKDIIYFYPTYEEYCKEFVSVPLF